MPDSASTVATHRLLRAFVDELCRCGLREACTSPGSRNTPIVLALAREPRLRAFSHIDERCAGFFAVGAAKAGGRPVAVTCTSGTAAAELLPAVVEAHWARVPLIVLTADRPAQLRDNGAGQAIDQLKLYGDHAKWFAEIELPPALDAAAMRWMRQLAGRAYWTAIEGRPGPVHLNLPLREPLILSQPLPPETEFPGRPDGRPWTRRAVSGTDGDPRARDARALPAALPPRTVIVAGGGAGDPGTVRAIDELAGRLGAPVLADPLSPVRRGPHAIGTYDLLLRDPAGPLARRLAPAAVVRVGDLPTSKPLRGWLAALPADTRQLILDPDATWQDPDAVAAEVWGGTAAATLSALTPPSHSPDPGDEDWRASWREADRAAATALEQALAESSQLSEPLVARRLGQWLAPEATLVCASSMPIRDLELYLPAGTPLPRVLSNRGANGIDGTVSTAFGVAATEPGGPVVLLIGDVALLHDLGGLLAARRLGLPLTIVVLNNDGGGIFHFLPISGEGEAFTEHVATPHGISLERAAALFELGYAHPQTEDELHDALARATADAEVTVIEVSTEREANLALHRALAAAGLAAAAAAGSPR